jgi:hypothetical protein
VYTYIFCFSKGNNNQRTRTIFFFRVAFGIIMEPGVSFDDGMAMIYNMNK